MWTYHPALNKPTSRIQASVMGAGNKETVWDYDDDGNTTPNENPTAQVHRLIERGYTSGSDGLAVVFEYITSFGYNTKGQLTYIDGPRPGAIDRVAYSYDDTTASLESITRPLVGTTYFTQYDAAGNPTHMTGPNGVETVFTYDGRNRVLTATRSGSTTSTTYTLRGKPDTITDGAGRTLDFQYGPENFLERVLDPSGNYQSFSYDALGNPDDKSVFTFGGQQTKTLRFDYGNPLTDPALTTGKPWKAIRRNHTDTDDLETVYTYDNMGNLASMTDPQGNVTAVQYDALNRITSRQQPGSTVTDYEYDDFGNLISVTDPEGLVTQYTYDDMGRLVKTESPDTGLVHLVYDEAGNMIRKDDNGLVSIYAYDGENRLVTISYTDGTPGVAYIYDTGAGDYQKGRLTGIVDAAGERYFVYDAQGYIDFEQRIINGVTYMTDFGFDAAGNLRTVVYPTGQTIEYIPDGTDAEMISQVRIDSSQIIADNMAYAPFGPLTGMSFGNGIQSAVAVDKNYQITAHSAAGILDRALTPDMRGNIEAITDNLDSSRNQNFGYDAVSRLTSANGIYGTIGFTYDRTGNRVSRTDSQETNAYTYIPGTNQIDAITGGQTINFTYDRRGNMVGRTFVDGTGPSAGETPVYTYTHDGQRVTKTMGTETTVFHYDLSGQLIAETDTSGNMLKAYVWLHGQPLVMIGASGDVFYFHNDHIGTPQKITDSTGAVVWAADYLPFGEANVTIAAIENNLRFAGQYYDAETGLHYNYHRYYDPSLGRYLRADPIGLEGGINLYTYAESNPINVIDPNGLAGISIDFGGDFSTGLTNTGRQAGSGLYIGAKNWYAELGGYTYQSKMKNPGPTGINGVASLGANINIYTTDANKFFPGKIKYHKWTPGIFAFGFYTDLKGDVIGYFLSLGLGFGVTADECGTSTGTQHALQD